MTTQLITDEQAIEYARELEKYCNNRRNCSECPFETDKSLDAWGETTDCIGNSLKDLKKPLGDAIG
jgi:hypothetical protein